MEESLIFFPIPSSEFLEKIRTMIEDVLRDQLSNQHHLPSELAEKTLLVPKEVCQVLRISRPTLYQLMKDGKLTGFKIQKRRYFARTDVERILHRQY